MLNAATIEFIRQHLDDDPVKLLLQQSRYPEVDMPMAAQQIEGRRQALDKWPSLARNEQFIYPPKLNREQSSSETTARYKAALIPTCSNLADLTGGMGIDSLFFATRAKKVHYCEMNAELCQLSQNNFSILGHNNILSHCGDSIAWIETQPPMDFIYIDPARRGSHGQRVQAFEDCTPNLLQHLNLLRSRCSTLIVKASPMIDLHLAMKQLQQVAEIHIVAVKGECKEVLFLLQDAPDPCTIHCVDIHPNHTFHNCFTLEEEQAATPLFAQQIEAYLYEPHTALMKGGAYHSLCQWYNVQKLAPSSHLYTSSRFIPDFPGRIFAVESTLSLKTKEVARLIPNKKIHLLAKNYPISTDDLRKKLKLQEGGDHHLIATTLASKPLGILCRHLHSPQV